jgi:hypothetical protein
VPRLNHNSGREIIKSSNALGPVTRSGQQAQGIAQFMPMTAGERLLRDPFDPIPVPKHLTSELMRRMIATRIQEEAFGTLDRATLELLDGLGRRDRSRTTERNLKVGTVLVRDHQGRRHTVTVEPGGYVWEGTAYSSLSAIARAITGTAWSGPRFFGLKTSGEQRNEQPDVNGRRRNRGRHESPSTAGAGTAVPR